MQRVKRRGEIGIQIGGSNNNSNNQAGGGDISSAIQQALRNGNLHVSNRNLSSLYTLLFQIFPRAGGGGEDDDEEDQVTGKITAPTIASSSSAGNNNNSTAGVAHPPLRTGRRIIMSSHALRGNNNNTVDLSGDSKELSWWRGHPVVQLDASSNNLTSLVSVDMSPQAGTATRRPSSTSSSSSNSKQSHNSLQRQQQHLQLQQQQQQQVPEEPQVALEEEQQLVLARFQRLGDSLKLLQISRNSLQSLPPFQNHQNLMTLDVSRNNLSGDLVSTLRFGSGSIGSENQPQQHQPQQNNNNNNNSNNNNNNNFKFSPGGSGALLPNLGELDASYNNFTSVLGLLDLLSPNLRVLRLSHNAKLQDMSLLSIRNPEQEPFVSSLRLIDVENNSLSSPSQVLDPLFVSHPCLEELNLSFSRFEMIGKKRGGGGTEEENSSDSNSLIFGKNTVMLTLHQQHPAFRQHMSNLHTLNLRKCGISNSSSSSQNQQQQQQQQQQNHHHQDQYPKLAFLNLPQLRDLNLSENFLTVFPFIDLSSRTQLASLDLSSNKLKCLDEIVMQPVSEFSLNEGGDTIFSHTQVSTAHQVPGVCPKLERLQLDNNDLSVIPPRLCLFSTLRFISLNGNPLRAIRRDLLSKNTNELKAFLRSRLDERENDESAVGSSKSLLIQEQMENIAQQQIQQNQQQQQQNQQQHHFSSAWSTTSAAGSGPSSPTAFSVSGASAFSGGGNGGFDSSNNNYYYSDETASQQSFQNQNQPSSSRLPRANQQQRQQQQQQSQSRTYGGNSNNTLSNKVIGEKSGNLWDLSFHGSPTLTTASGVSSNNINNQSVSRHQVSVARVGGSGKAMTFASSFSSSSSSSQNKKTTSNTTPLLPELLTAEVILSVSPHTQSFASECGKLSLVGQSRLQTISSDFFECFVPQLTELDLSRTSIRSLEFLGDQNGPLQLKALTASRCGLQGAWPLEWCRPAPREMQKLATLDLSYNNLTFLPEEAFLAIAWSLKSLSINGNKISQFPQGILHCRGLNELLYSGNGLSDASLAPFEDLSPYFPNLVTLDVSFNDLRSVQVLPRAFGNFSPNTLRALKLSGNGCKFLSTALIEGPTPNLLAALKSRCG